jgi:hypothetical protein
MREFRRDLRAIDRTLPREVTKAERAAAAPIAAAARQLAPRRSGALVASIRPFANARQVGVSASVPYAGWIHWGGTISPRGVSMRRTGTSAGAKFVVKAADRQMNRFEWGLGQAIESVARRNGFR